MQWEVTMIPFDQSWIESYFPNYFYVTTLTSGGQKDVCLADNIFGERFVIKIVSPESDRERIMREIDIVKQHSFDHVPKIIECKIITYAQHELLAIVEEYVAGENLRYHLHNSDLNYDLVKDIVYQLLSIVVQLENAGVVHRDIKPENVILTEDKHVWLIDFGIALDLSKTALTSPAARYGACTLGYAAPEQIRNMKAEISSKADLFSIGIMAFELLTKTHPFIDGSQGQLDILFKTENIQVPPIPPNYNVPSQFDSFIHWLSARYPSQRPESAAFALQCFKKLFMEA